MRLGFIFPTHVGGGSSALRSRRGSLCVQTTLFAGGHGGAVIPVPVPNTEVKGPIAEGSAELVRARVGRRRLFPFIRPAPGRAGRESTRIRAFVVFRRSPVAVPSRRSFSATCRVSAGSPSRRKPYVARTRSARTGCWLLAAGMLNCSADAFFSPFSPVWQEQSLLMRRPYSTGTRHSLWYTRTS